MKSHSNFIPHTKLNSKWSRDLNVRAKTLIRKQVNLRDIGLGSGFLDVTLKDHTTKKKMDKFGLHHN